VIRGLSDDERAFFEPLRNRERTPARPVPHSNHRAIYALRNRIERFINRRKNSRRAAIRSDHTASTFSASGC
jgi:hypothetical protein